MGTSAREYEVFEQKPSFNASLWDWFRGAGHSRATRRFLRDLSIYRHSLVVVRGFAPLPHVWLLPFRDDFRQMKSMGAVAEIQDFVRYGDGEMRHVGIWLLSQQASRFELLEIDRYCYDSSATVRKHVAKALRRLEVWNLIVEMPETFANDAWINCFTPSLNDHRPFRERLEDFARNVDDSHASEVATPSRMPYWAMRQEWEYTPPKSRELIRRMLRRIRHWVRWGVG